MSSSHRDRDRNYGPRDNATTAPTSSPVPHSSRLHSPKSRRTRAKISLSEVTTSQPTTPLHTRPVPDRTISSLPTLINDECTSNEPAQSSSLDDLQPAKSGRVRRRGHKAQMKPVLPLSPRSSSCNANSSKNMSTMNDKATNLEKILNPPPVTDDFGSVESQSGVSSSTVDSLTSISSSSAERFVPDSALLMNNGCDNSTFKSGLSTRHNNPTPPSNRSHLSTKNTIGTKTGYVYEYEPLQHYLSPLPGFEATPANGPNGCHNRVDSSKPIRTRGLTQPKWTEATYQQMVQQIHALPSRYELDQYSLGQLQPPSQTMDRDVVRYDPNNRYSSKFNLLRFPRNRNRFYDYTSFKLTYRREAYPFSPEALLIEFGAMPQQHQIVEIEKQLILASKGYKHHATIFEHISSSKKTVTGNGNDSNEHAKEINKEMSIKATVNVNVSTKAHESDNHKEAIAALIQKAAFLSEYYNLRNYIDKIPPVLTPTSQFERTALLTPEERVRQNSKGFLVKVVRFEPTIKNQLDSLHRRILSYIWNQADPDNELECNQVDWDALYRERIRHLWSTGAPLAESDLVATGIMSKNSQTKQKKAVNRAESNTKFSHIPPYHVQKLKEQQRIPIKLKKLIQSHQSLDNFPDFQRSFYRQSKIVDEIPYSDIEEWFEENQIKIWTHQERRTELERLMSGHKFAAARRQFIHQTVTKMSTDSELIPLGLAQLNCLRLLDTNDSPSYSPPKAFDVTFSTIKSIPPELNHSLVSFDLATTLPSFNSLRPCLDFEHVGFPDYIQRIFQNAHFTTPTTVQSLTWPLILSGLDIVGIAPTGSGKTLAFLLPAIIHVNAQPRTIPGQGPVALVLAPTRDLALQIHGECQRMIAGTAITTTLLIRQQQTQAELSQICTTQRMDILITTSGVLADALQFGDFNLNRVTLLIMDEADNFTTGNGIDSSLDTLFKVIRRDRQVVLFSSTWNMQSDLLIHNKLQTSPLVVQIGEKAVQLKDSVHHQTFITQTQLSQFTESVKFLLDFCHRYTEPILVFCSSRDEVEQIATQLRTLRIPTGYLHSTQDPVLRLKTLSDFRLRQFRVLCSTDEAARGLDIPDLKYILNVGLPKEFENFIHRSGRVGRAGNRGWAFNIVSMTANAPVIAPFVQALKDANQELNPRLIKFAEESKRTIVPRSILNGSSQNMPFVNPYAMDSPFEAALLRAIRVSPAIKADSTFDINNIDFIKYNPYLSDETTQSFITARETLNSFVFDEALAIFAALRPSLKQLSKENFKEILREVTQSTRPFQVTNFGIPAPPADWKAILEELHITKDGFASDPLEEKKKLEKLKELEPVVLTPFEAWKASTESYNSKDTLHYLRSGFKNLSPAPPPDLIERFLTLMKNGLETELIYIYNRTQAISTFWRVTETLPFYHKWWKSAIVDNSQRLGLWSYHSVLARQPVTDFHSFPDDKSDETPWAAFPVRNSLPFPLHRTTTPPDQSPVTTTDSTKRTKRNHPKEGPDFVSKFPILRDNSTSFEDQQTRLRTNQHYRDKDLKREEDSKNLAAWKSKAARDAKLGINQGSKSIDQLQPAVKQSFKKFKGKNDKSSETALNVDQKSRKRKPDPKFKSKNSNSKASNSQGPPLKSKTNSRTKTQMRDA